MILTIFQIEDKLEKVHFLRGFLKGQYQYKTKYQNAFSIFNNIDVIPAKKKFTQKIYPIIKAQLINQKNINHQIFD